MGRRRAGRSAAHAPIPSPAGASLRAPWGHFSAQPTHLPPPVSSAHRRCRLSSNTRCGARRALRLSCADNGDRAARFPPVRAQMRPLPAHHLRERVAGAPPFNRGSALCRRAVRRSRDRGRHPMPCLDAGSLERRHNASRCQGSTLCRGRQRGKLQIWSEAAFCVRCGAALQAGYHAARDPPSADGAGLRRCARRCGVDGKVVLRRDRRWCLQAKWSSPEEYAWRDYPRFLSVS